MSYAVAAALQQAIYRRLADDDGVAALVGNAVFDAVPAGLVPPLYVSLGPEEVRDSSDKTGGGATHDFTVSVVTDQAGFHGAKEVAGAVSDAILRGGFELERGRLVFLHFLRAKAGRRRDATQRRIDLRFRARVEDR